MTRITVADASRHVGESVQIPGWLYNLRRSGKILFPQIRDGTGIMQCVAQKSALPEEVFETPPPSHAGVITDRIRPDSGGGACAGRL